MSRRSGSDDGGYIMVALLVGVAIASIWMSAALPSWRQQAIREKEAELIFRGEQYARAVRLYQQKMNGALPSSVDDLISQHVLRKKWKDPITGEDFLPKAGCANIGVPGVGAPVMPGTPITPGRGSTPTTPGRGPGVINPFNPGMTQPGQTPSGRTPGALNPFNPAVPAPLPGQTGRGPGGVTVPAQVPGGIGQPVGGGICGVQSRSKAASIKIYNGQQEYDLWQFDTMTAGLLYQQNVMRLGGGVGMPGVGFPVGSPGIQMPGGGPFIPGGPRGPGGRGPAGPGGGRGPFGPGGIGPGGQSPAGPGRGTQPPMPIGGRGRGE